METLFVVCIIAFIVSLIVDAHAYTSRNLYLEGIARFVMLVCIAICLVGVLVLILKTVIWN